MIVTQVQQNLKEIIENSVLPDIEEYLDELFEIVAVKKDTQDDRNTILQMQEMKQDFEGILREIEANEIDDEECIEILEELQEMFEE